MKHARPDYDRIQDPDGLIPEDEPVFLIRGQDIAGPIAVEAWAAAAERLGADPEIVARAFQQSCAMREWQSSVAKKVLD